MLWTPSRDGSLQRYRKNEFWECLGNIFDDARPFDALRLRDPEELGRSEAEAVDSLLSDESSGSLSIVGLRGAGKRWRRR